MANPLSELMPGDTSNPLDPYDRWNVRPLYLGPVGSSQVGGDTALTMPSPDVSPVVGWYGQKPVTAATRSNALDIANAALQFGPADVAAIRGFHGSPHLFAPTPRNPLGEFDPMKIGTGEGNQAFGVGAGYIAEREPVAKGYRDRLTGKSGPRPGDADYIPQFSVGGVDPPTGMAGHAAMDTAIDMHGLFNYMDMYANKPSMSQFWKQGDPIHPDFDARPSYVQSINYLKGQIERRIAAFRDRLGGDQPSGIADRDMAAVADYYDKHVKDATPFDIEKRPPGHMYEVNIHADPEHFLDWDKPLSEQSRHVQDALAAVKDAGHVREQWGGDDPRGEHLYESMTARAGGDPAGASQRLQDAGVAGIRYLDAGSRTAPRLSDAERQQLEAAIADKQRLIADPRQQRDIATHQADLDLFQRRLNEADRVTRNYVVFSPETIEILRRYGIAGLIGGGAAAGAASGGTGQEQ